MEALRGVVVRVDISAGKFEQCCQDAKIDIVGELRSLAAMPSALLVVAQEGKGADVSEPSHLQERLEDG